MINEMNFDLKTYLARRQSIVNLALDNILAAFDPGRELIRAMSHALIARGKRLRPILCMATAEICGADPLIALPASCAVEMIHTYSLIHDDLPALDDDDLRRGRPTCHKQFGEASAILAGDALLTHAFYVISRPRDYFDIYPCRDRRLSLVGKIAWAAGVNGMVEGQVMDMQSQSFSKEPKSPVDHLKALHTLKTGKMICVSVEAGAVSAGADPDAADRLLVYAEKIGLAFQVMDDILNIEGDPEVMGKAAGSDKRSNKMTFPAVIGLDQSRSYAEELVAQALDALNGFDRTASRPLQAIARYIIDRDR